MNAAHNDLVTRTVARLSNLGLIAFVDRKLSATETRIFVAAPNAHEDSDGEDYLGDITVTGKAFDIPRAVQNAIDAAKA